MLFAACSPSSCSAAFFRSPAPVEHITLEVLASRRAHTAKASVSKIMEERMDKGAADAVYESKRNIGAAAARGPAERPACAAIFRDAGRRCPARFAADPWNERMNRGDHKIVTTMKECPAAWTCSQAKNRCESRSLCSADSCSAQWRPPSNASSARRRATSSLHGQNFGDSIPATAGLPLPAMSPLLRGVRASTPGRPGEA